ncbi:MAG: hypothetical protein KGY38_05065 [Desulfobacterales bacterium]|nr:hypothetical protein [Desulfobacterales bacterium]
MSNTGWRYTLTLARLFESQGYFEQASEIYGKLLEKDPENKAVSECCREFKNKRQKDTQTNKSGQLETLFAQWIDLVVRAGNLTSY